MNFIIMNYEVIFTVLTMLVVFLATFIFIPFAQKKGWMSQSNIDKMNKALDIASVALSTVNLGAGLASKTALILKATEAAVGYVEQTMKLEDNEAKRLNAQNEAIRFLEQEGIVITDDLRKLIEVGLQSAVNSLPKTVK